MKKEEEKQQPQAPETPSQEPVNPPAAPSETPNEDLFMENMGKKYPDIAGNREAIFGKSMEAYDGEHEYAKKARKQAESIDSILSKNEAINDFFIDLFKFGEEGHPELALPRLKPLYQQFINGELNSEELEAEIKRMQEADAKTQSLKAMAEEAWNEECKERGWDPEETKEKLFALIGQDCETKEECREQVKNMLRILEYDDAVAAAETRGRNAKIKEQQRNHPAGVETLPRNGGAAAGANAPKRSLLGQAADAAAKRRAEYEQ